MPSTCTASGDLQAPLMGLHSRGLRIVAETWQLKQLRLIKATIVLMNNFVHQHRSYGGSSFRNFPFSCSGSLVSVGAEAGAAAGAAAAAGGGGRGAASAVSVAGIWGLLGSGLR